MARSIGSDGVKTKAAIVDAALYLIAQSGFEALTMRALSAAVGLQVGALYYHFKDKQALLALLLGQHFDRLLDGFSNVTLAETPNERLVQFINFHIQFHGRDRLNAMLAVQEMRSLDRENAAILLKRRSNYERQLRVILQDGVYDGCFKIDEIALTTSGILALLSEVSVWFRPGGKQTLDEMAAAQATMVLKMVSA